ncbi:MAG: GNAT family N-acetyltransferase [Acidimicrobiales bacterium]
MTDADPTDDGPRLATLADREVVARIAASGFYDDPVLSWVLRDDARRLDQLLVVFGGLVDDTLPDRGTIHLVAGASAAFWRNPGFEHHRTASDRLEDAAANGGGADLGPFEMEELERFGVLGDVMKEHHPHEEHWYLNVVGTLPERQGRGLGSAVLRPVLEHCDAEGVPAYLESTNPRNRSLYVRHGFVVSKEIPLPDGPTMAAMWRDPMG